MAGEWIAIQNVTPDKPEVFRLAELLGIDPDAVLGKLCRIWIWADEQTYDGDALSVTKTSLDRLTFAPGFADALEKVGWLAPQGEGYTFPNFDRWNGQTAKKRALGRQRTRIWREKECDASVTLSASQKRHQRREEKSNTPYSPPKGDEGELWSFVVEEQFDGNLPPSKSRSVKGIVADLHGLMPGAEDQAIVGEYQRRRDRFRSKWPNVAVTFRAVISHWGELGTDGEPGGFERKAERSRRLDEQIANLRERKAEREAVGADVKALGAELDALEQQREAMQNG